MPFIIIAVGIILLVSAYNKTYTNLYALLKGDLTGPNNFIFWILTIIVVGAVGYIPALKKVSVAFLILIIVVLFLKKGQGFFPQFQNAIAGVQNG